MYCRKCYADLTDATDEKCSRCGQPFESGDPRTMLSRPFPDKEKILRHVIKTTIITAVVAFVVACFQLANASGH